MATRRGALFRDRMLQQEVTGGAHVEEKENVIPIPGDELEIVVQEGHGPARCQSRRHPRIPLRDMSHLFLGNIAFLDDKTEASPPNRQSLGNGPVRRAVQNSRKRRLASKTSTTRRVLRKLR